MGLFTFLAAGVGFILIGGYEAIASSNTNRGETQNTSPSSPSSNVHLPTQTRQPSCSSSASRSLSLKIASISSSLFIINSLVSLIDAINSSDGLGSALQLQVLAIEFLFLLYSVLGILINDSKSISLPSSLVSLVGLFAFVEEFLLFYIQRKDTSGIENQYYDLLLVPISVCLFSTMFELRYPKSHFPKLGRGIGLILQGTWFIQMGLSFFSDLMANGCSVNRKSRGNYTIKCKGHPDYHRARAIATLQFNCHLALLVALITGIYSILCQKNGVQGDFSRYRPLGAELQQFESPTQFTLDSDDDIEEEVREDHNVEKKKPTAVEAGMNGHGSH